MFNNFSVTNSHGRRKRHGLHGKYYGAFKGEHDFQLLSPVRAAVMAVVDTVNDMDYVRCFTCRGSPCCILRRYSAVPCPFHYG